MAKKPKVSVAPSAAKLPRIEGDPTSFHQHNPSWRFSKMEFCDPYGWHILNAPMVTEIRGKLCNFESMTWAEILVTGKKRNHQIPVGQLVPAARKRLIEIGQGDLGQVVSLHLTGTQRVWGILREGVLHLLWWDPNHGICPSILKNT